MSSPFSYSEKIIQTLSLSLSLSFFLLRKNYSDSFPLSFPSLFLVQKKLFRLFPSLFPFPFSCSEKIIQTLSLSLSLPFFVLLVQQPYTPHQLEHMSKSPS